MDTRFQQHLMQVQIKEMVTYIESLENNNTIMLQFIQQHGLGGEFAKLLEPQEAEAMPMQTSSPVEVQE